MNKCGISTEPLTWFIAFLVAVFIAGCGSGGGGGETDAMPSTSTAAGRGSGAGGLGHGPAPLNLGTAANYVILGVFALTNQPSSVVTGNVGLTKVSGAQIGLTCAEVAGQIVSIDSVATSNAVASNLSMDRSGSKAPKAPKGSGSGTGTGTGTGSDPACHVTNASALTQGELDADDAFLDATTRRADYSELGAGNIGGFNLGPAVYSWSSGVSIPTNLTLTGGPNDVWIFRTTQGLNVSPGVQIVLNGGALPQNIFWAPTHDVELGATSQFKGVLLPAAAIFMRTGASINGKLLAAEIHLEKNTVGP